MYVTIVGLNDDFDSFQDFLNLVVIKGCPCKVILYSIYDSNDEEANNEGKRRSTPTVKTITSVLDTGGRGTKGRRVR